MWIELDYSPDLKTDEISAFIVSKDPAAVTFQSPVMPQAGMTAVSQRPPEQADLPGPLCAFRKETYAIERDRQGVGRQEIIVPVEQAMRLTVLSNLLVRDDLVATDTRKVLERVFLAFDASKDDPLDYARRELPADITEDMFVVRPSFELKKNGNPVERTEQRDAFLALYEGKATGDFHLPISGIDGIGDYFKKGNYTVVLISAEPCRISAPDKDTNIHETDSIDDDPGPVIDALVRQEAETMDCNRIETIKERAATLIQWPEFKIEWESRRIKIGCVRISVVLPILYIRTTKLALYYFYGKIQNLGKLIEQIISTCAIKAVLAGAIIGIALSNIQAAIVAFRTVFVECVKSQTTQAIMCLIPGLLIVKERGTWKQA